MVYIESEFDNLKVEEKSMVLDICYLFYNCKCLQGILKERTLQIWTNSKDKIFKKDIEYIFNTLMNQSLIKVDKERIIRIHDQL